MNHRATIVIEPIRQDVCRRSPKVLVHPVQWERFRVACLKLGADDFDAGIQPGERTRYLCAKLRGGMDAGAFPADLLPTARAVLDLASKNLGVRVGKTVGNYEDCIDRPAPSPAPKEEDSDSVYVIRR